MVVSKIAKMEKEQYRIVESDTGWQNLDVADVYLVDC